MKIASFLRREDVSTQVPQGDKRAVLACLVDLLKSNHDELDRDVLLHELLKREELRSTGIEEGVAFPHGRIPGIDKLIACFGRCQEGVDFDAFDGEPTHFFFVLLIPEEAEGSHLKALARLNRVFQDREFRGCLQAAEDAGAIFDIIVTQDNKCDERSDW
jgi:PTS system nitrogen regulatory IIA component